MLKLDHLKLVKRDWREVEKLRKILLNIEAGKVSEFAVLHEEDDKCCKKESWNQTYRAIHDGIKPPLKAVRVDIVH